MPIGIGCENNNPLLGAGNRKATCPISVCPLAAHPQTCIFAYPCICITQCPIGHYPTEFIKVRITLAGGLTKVAILRTHHIRGAPMPSWRSTTCEEVLCRNFNFLRVMTLVCIALAGLSKDNSKALEDLESSYLRTYLAKADKLPLAVCWGRRAITVG